MRKCVKIAFGVATAVAAAGCDRLRIEEPPPPIPKAAVVSVRPASLELPAGESVQLAAQASTPERQPIGGAPLDFVAVTPGLIHVTSTGLATSLGPAGTAEVIARSGSTDGGAVINVIAGPPAAIRAAAGAGQTGEVGLALEQPIVASVTDAFGNPVRGVPVEIFASSSGGSVSPQRGVTDSDGRIEATWVLGPRAGRQSIAIAVAERRDLVVPFVASASAGQVTALRPAVALDTATAGDAVALRVEARDTFGNPAAGSKFAWRATSGAIAAAPDDPTNATWTPGAAGTATIVAAVPGTELQATWTVEVVPGPAATLAAVEPAPESARPGAPLGALAVRVTDSAGNPVPNHPVSFAAEGGGTVEPTAAVTDASGVATIDRWSLGDEDSQVLRATVASLAPVTFTVELRRRGRRR